GDSDEGPFEARASAGRDRLSVGDAERQQAVRELVDSFGGLAPGHVAPLALNLVQVRRIGPPLGHRVPPEVGDRSWAGFHLRQSSERSGAAKHESTLSYYTFPCRCAQPGTAPSASASSTSPSGSLPRRRRL